MQDFISANYYDVLGVPKGASFEDIKKAYRKKVITCHPDHHPNDKTAEEEFKKLSIAYKILQDPEKRKHYDFVSSVSGATLSDNPVINDFVEAFKHIINDVTNDVKDEFINRGASPNTRKPRPKKQTVGYTVLKQGGIEFKIKR